MNEQSGNIMLLKQEIDKRINFINKYLALGESHMVDYFVSDHWKTHVHPQVRSKLLEFSETDLYSVKDLFKKVRAQANDTKSESVLPVSYTIPCLEQYFSEAEDCAIHNSAFCITLDEVKDKIDKKSTAQKCSEANEFPELINTHEYMCNKKSHEVHHMSDLVTFMCKQLEVQNVLDIGSGKGYLGTHLSLRYGLDVVGVDCSESNSANALTRSQKLLKYWSAHLKNKTSKQMKNEIKYRAITHLVDKSTDMSFLFQNNLSLNSCVSVLLTALHACGDLSSTALRTFTNRQEIRAMCVVGCCYHQLSSNKNNKDCKNESEEDGFPMSNYLKQKNFSLERNLKLLGLKALDRIQSTDALITEEKSTRSLFYRATLSIILEKEVDLDGKFKDLRVGKTYGKSKNFIHYVRLSLKTLGVSCEKIESLSDDTISSYFKSYEPFKKTLLAFNMLREAYGPSVEAIILLDKLLYLEENNLSLHVFDSYLVKLFDPVLSPRCFALVALKTPILN